MLLNASNRVVKKIETQIVKDTKNAHQIKQKQQHIIQITITLPAALLVVIHNIEQHFMRHFNRSEKLKLSCLTLWGGCSSVGGEGQLIKRLMVRSLAAPFSSLHV